jgi:alpha-beta hydrolase superfamily lysophospholipase
MLNFVDEYIKINIKDKPFMIMGHSMGGGIALSTYTKHKSHIAAVILECPLTPAVFVRRSQIDKNDLKNFSQKIKRTRELIKSK